MIVGIIPARGGSKGIPRKNIKEISGKPLIAWTIESALQSNGMDEVYVSTEDEEIAVVSKNLGAKVLERPISLSDDNATTVSVLKYHLLNDLSNIETLVLLQCTSPFRNPDLIDLCIKKYMSENADSLATGYQCKIEKWGSSDRPRQEMEGFFYDDGNVYILNREVILNNMPGLRGGKSIEFLTHRNHNHEIDDEFDFWLAEKILEKETKKDV
jgi:CMP-N-acetylneuraminic acid synthetase